MNSTGQSGWLYSSSVISSKTFVEFWSWRYGYALWLSSRFLIVTNSSTALILTVDIRTKAFDIPPLAPLIRAMLTEPDKTRILYTIETLPHRGKLIVANLRFGPFLRPKCTVATSITKPVTIVLVTKARFSFVRPKPFFTGTSGGIMVYEIPKSSQVIFSLFD